jgi:hypothetical protein
MLSRIFPAMHQRRSPHLPQRRWSIRPPHTYLLVLLGALVGAAAPFYLWWVSMTPLWLIALTMIAGGMILAPSPVLLGLDERGMALIIPGWRDRYLWIPRERLARLQIQNGWLVAIGMQVEQQGEMSWMDVARQAGAIIPPWLALLFQSPAAPVQIAAPIYLLDQLARDEIELWLYRQGK